MQPLLHAPGKRGRKFGDGVRDVVNGVLYIIRTVCQWRCLPSELPSELGPWTLVWSQFRRLARNCARSCLLAEVHRGREHTQGVPVPRLA